MALPKLAIKTYKTNLPTNNKEIEFRQYQVKEERALLMANEATKPEEQLTAMINLLRACVLTPDFDPQKITQTDLEWLFIRMRVESVGSSSKIKRVCESCEKEYPIELDLDNVQVIRNQNHKLRHNITDDGKTGLEFKLPTLSVLSEVQSLGEIDQFFTLIEKCLYMVWQDDNVWVAGKDFTDADAKEFINQLDQSTYEKIVQETFNLSPKVMYTSTSECPHCKAKEEISVEGLFNFFV